MIMSGAEKFGKKISSRAEKFRPPNTHNILIYCEGERTEPNYFKNFKNYFTQSRLVNIQEIGLGFNTLSLVNYAIEERNVLIRREVGARPTECWVVFDKDSFPDKNFNDAISLANANEIYVAVSNESFELWYILHFEYLNACISRKDYINKLTKHLGYKYEKNDPKVFSMLESKINDAINHARKLEGQYADTDAYSARCPYTSVYKLVERLLSIKTKFESIERNNISN